jgi:hypothetical protein
MIRYALVCDHHHDFESWFSNSAAYDEQAGKGLVACPLCGSTKVEKALMTPRLGRSDSSSFHQDTPRRDARPDAGGEAGHEHQEQAAPQPAEAPSGTQGGDDGRHHGGAPAPPVAVMTPPEQELRRKLRELRDHLVRNAENVGARFTEEARKMHYGEAVHRSIYGVASAEDAEALHEEGIAFSALPVLPDDRN